MIFRTEALETWKLSTPIILGELTQMALGVIDNIMVGSISYKHLAAAALVISVMNIPFVLGIGMTCQYRKPYQWHMDVMMVRRFLIIYIMDFGFVPLRPS